MQIYVVSTSFLFQPQFLCPLWCPHFVDIILETERPIPADRKATVPCRDTGQSATKRSRYFNDSVHRKPLPRSTWKRSFKNNSERYKSGKCGAPSLRLIQQHKYKRCDAKGWHRKNTRSLDADASLASRIVALQGRIYYRAGGNQVFPSFEEEI